MKLLCVHHHASSVDAADFLYGQQDITSLTICVSCRKKAVEMELAKCKIDIMSLNSQLLDAIQQKLNLSQQLEAWQVGQRPQGFYY